MPSNKLTKTTNHKEEAEMNTHAKILPTTATIDQLKPGHERPGGSVNSRKEYGKPDVEGRLASIIAHGLLRPMLVLYGPDSDQPPFYVADGGLSRAAIELGVKTKKLPKDYEVKISVSDLDGAAALAASIEANDQVVPPHPVKVFEAFAELGERGKTEAEIAAMFRLKPQQVRGYLALGALSPKIRKAWLEEELDEDDAKVFTLASDQKHQDEVFDRLKKSRNLHAHYIRQAIIGDSRDNQRFLTYVGRAAYEAAGGKLAEDLFSDGKHFVVQSPDVLKKLADDKYAAAAQTLKDAGWGEVLEKSALPNDHWYNWKKATGGAKASAGVKAKAVAAYSLDRDGKFEVEYLVRPGDKKTGKTKAAAKAAPAGPAKISNSLDHRLDSTLMRATQDALKALAQPAKTLEHITAAVIAAQLQPDRGEGYTPSPIRNALKTIRERLPAKLLNEALAKRFDAKDYFSSVPKPFVIKALNEAGFADEAKKLDAGTKAAAWKRAVQIIPKTGWLPGELRTPHYAGPGAAKKKAAR